MADQDANAMGEAAAGKGATPDTAATTESRLPYERDLDDAVYYLGQGCEPCAQRHFDRARRHGASELAIETARSRARVG